MPPIPSPIEKWVRQYITGEGASEVSSQAPVQSVNSQTGNVTVTAPVDSVNGETGTVSLSASDVGALALSSDVDHQQTTNRTHDGDDISPSSVTTEALEAKKLTKDYFFAGSYDGANADARLDNALADAISGDTIYLEHDTYNTDRTISQRIRFVGAGAHNAGTIIDAKWTLNSRVSITGVWFESISGRTVEVDNRSCAIINCALRGSAEVYTIGDRFRFIGNEGGSVTFGNGSSSCVVDGCVTTTVNDNGSGNTIGDLA